MTTKDVCTRLKSYGAADNITAKFEENAVTGRVISDGLNDDDLKDLGFMTPVQRRGVASMLLLITSNNEGSAILYYFML